jgi:uncharacterized protein YwqG
VVWGWIFGKRDAIENSGKLDDVLRVLRENSRPCVLLRDGDGNSRIGGHPDGLRSEDWPIGNATPLTFLAQLDLAEVRQAGGPDWLPADGTLLFFYDVAREPWGFDPAERDGWRVIYRPRDEQSPGAVPGGDPAFVEKRLGMKADVSLPDANPDRFDISLDGLTDAEFDGLYDVQEELYDGLPAHQVGGFASPIQGDTMELEAQLASNGIYCGNASGYEDPRAKLLAAGAKEWLLLLQLDSDDDTGMMWGDAGRLYFWIREEDARRADFSKVWLVLQCC